MADPSPQVTPKRKRGEQAPTTPISFSIHPPDDGSNSPRSCVAHRFRRLELGGGGGEGGVVAAGDGAGLDAAQHKPKRKRQTPNEGLLARAELLPQPDVAIASTEAAADDALPAANGPPAPASPRRRRAGTPPLRLKKSPDKDGDDGPPVADPVRAALTWHEDEITIYDPDDKDDDGTGINGIGFKPTPALAAARAIKRRHQMAAYRRREENEARSKRSERRQAATPMPSGGISKKRSPARRVRFIDAESRKVAVTTV